VSWQERAVERSGSVQRAHERTLDQVTRVVGAARALLDERAGQDFTIAEVTARAGVALQTFYRLFPSKDLLLLAVFEDVVTEATAALRDATSALPDPLERLRVVVEGSIWPTVRGGVGVTPDVLVRQHYRLLERYPAEIENAQREFVALVGDLIEDAVTSGALPPRADTQRDAALITYLVRSVFQLVATSAVPEDREALAEHTWRFCLYGLSRPA
jgi:AcrR family transcriptional regulator